MAGALGQLKTKKVFTSKAGAKMVEVRIALCESSMGKKKEPVKWYNHKFPVKAIGHYEEFEKWEIGEVKAFSMKIRGKDGKNGIVDNQIFIPTIKESEQKETKGITGEIE